MSMKQYLKFFAVSLGFVVTHYAHGLVTFLGCDYNTTMGYQTGSQGAWSMQTFTGNSATSQLFEQENLVSNSGYFMGGKTKGLLMFFPSYLTQDYITWKAYTSAYRTHSGWFLGYYGGEGFAMVSMGARFRVDEKVLMTVHSDDVFQNWVPITFGAYREISIDGGALWNSTSTQSGVLHATYVVEPGVHVLKFYSDMTTGSSPNIDGSVTWDNKYFKTFGVPTDTNYVVFEPYHTSKVAGKVQLENWTKPMSARQTVFSLYDIWGNSHMVTWSDSILGADGSFSKNVAPLLLFQRPYALIAKPKGGLAKRVDFVGDQATGLNFVCENGDITGDNYIGTDDYLVLNDYFDWNSGDAGWSTVGPNGFAPVDADLNGNNAVTTDDYLILNANFDKAGDTF